MIVMKKPRPKRTPRRTYWFYNIVALSALPLVGGMEMEPDDCSLTFCRNLNFNFARIGSGSAMITTSKARLVAARA